MEYSINFTEITEYEGFYIDGGRNVAGVVVGVVGILAVGGAIALAAVYCPPAINGSSMAAAATVVVGCIALIGASW